MKYGIYVTKDDLASDYSEIKMIQNDAVATRGFLHSLRDPRIPDPRDMSLYKVGIYDSETGLIESHEITLVHRGEVIKDGERIQ